MAVGSAFGSVGSDKLKPCCFKAALTLRPTEIGIDFLLTRVSDFYGARSRPFRSWPRAQAQAHFRHAHRAPRALGPIVQKLKAAGVNARRWQNRLVAKVPAP